jgi:hypothetical protein
MMPCDSQGTTMVLHNDISNNVIDIQDIITKHGVGLSQDWQDECNEVYRKIMDLKIVQATGKDKQANPVGNVGEEQEDNVISVYSFEGLDKVGESIMGKITVQKFVSEAVGVISVTSSSPVPTFPIYYYIVDTRQQPHLLGVVSFFHYRALPVPIGDIQEALKRHMPNDLCDLDPDHLHLYDVPFTAIGNVDAESGQALTLDVPAVVQRIGQNAPTHMLKVFIND